MKTRSQDSSQSKSWRKVGNSIGVIQSCCNNPAIPALSLLKTANASCAKEAQTTPNTRAPLISFPKTSLKRNWLLVVQPDHHHPDGTISSKAPGRGLPDAVLASCRCPRQCPIWGRASRPSPARRQAGQPKAALPQPTWPAPLAAGLETTKATAGLANQAQLLQLFGELPSSRQDEKHAPHTRAATDNLV